MALNIPLTVFRNSARQQAIDAVVLEDSSGTLIEDLSLIKDCVDQSVPVIVVGEQIRTGFATALACGAADYICLSRMGHDELALRLRGHIEASRWQGGSTLRVKDCLLDAARMQASCGNHVVELTHKELELAWVLFSKPDQLVTNSTIVARVWGRTADLNKRTLEQHVYKLRAKLDQLGSDLRVSAVYGRGYRLLSSAALPVRTRRKPALPMTSAAPSSPGWGLRA